MENISIQQKQATVDIANKIRNTTLSKKQGMLPLFEVISNSIHSIEERKNAGLMDAEDKGRIIVTVIRNGDPATLARIPNDDDYPIQSFEVEDDGIGLNDDNLNSFIEADSAHKYEIGGKGIGRFVCMKAFHWVSMKSTFKQGDTFLKRSIKLKNTRKGFEEFDEENATVIEFKTVCSLNQIYDQYVPYNPKTLEDIAAAIITHFQIYFMRDEMPHVIVRNQNNYQKDLNTEYRVSFQSKVQNDDFKIGDVDFKVYLSKSNSAKSHRLHYCAHNRSVKEDWLGKYIIELGKNAVLEEGKQFYYAAFVVSEVLDNSVNNERTGFTFPSNDDDDDDNNDNSEDITLSKIRRAAIIKIESMIAEYIDKAREKKIEDYKRVVDQEMPQYKVVMSQKPDKVKRLAANLSKHDLDIELYKIESDWKTEIKQKGTKILEDKVDVTTYEEYKKLYDEYVTDLNDIGQAELARYVTHRKSIIDLLDLLTSRDDIEDKYENENLLHSVFFPIRSTSEVIPYEKQNLWLLDERLAYHSYLASDKLFQSMEGVEVSEHPEDRPDMLILSNAFAFSEDNDAPYQSIAIVEFKKPERDNYVDNDDKKNPLDQVERYVENLIGGKIKNRKGRTITIHDRTPFYIYIVCDLTPSICRILERREFKKTPDGLGYYAFKNVRYNGVVEVLSYEKVKADARKRNQILFDKLGLPDKEWSE